MVKADVWHEIHSRFKLRETKKEIARALGLDVRTVRRLLRQEAPRPYEREPKGSRLLAGFEERIKRRVAAVGYCAMSIYEELRADGYRGGYDVVRRFVSPLREEATVEATMRFETPPGQQGQADWGQCWTIIAGRRVKVHLFVLTLGYSRRMYAVATSDEKMPAFLRSHEEAFEHLGGVTHEIVYDNLRSVVLGRDFEGSRFEWNPVFWDFSRHCGFRPTPHRPDQGQGGIGRQVRQALPQGEGLYEPRRSQLEASRVDRQDGRRAHPRDDPSQALGDVPRGEGPAARREGPASLCDRGTLAQIRAQGLPNEPLLGPLPPGRQACRSPDRWRDDQDLSLGGARLLPSAARGHPPLVRRPDALLGPHQGGEAGRGTSGRRRGQGPGRLLEGGLL